ncbi:MAG TPA: translation initiation factor [Patescibacteria group bacterium]|nr:translation initiation factor [Patescibacteria group bacterium]
MSKLSSLSELANLLPNDYKAAQDNTRVARTGYDGKSVMLIVKLDNKKRSGKMVTVVCGFQSNPPELEELLKSLKKLCGAGGQLLDNTIEIQGDHRDKIVEKLKSLEYKVQKK